MASTALVPSVLAHMLLLAVILALACCRTENEEWHGPHSSRISAEPAIEVELVAVLESEVAPMLEEASELHVHPSSSTPPPPPPTLPSSIVMDNHRGWHVILLPSAPLPESPPLEASPEFHTHPSSVIIF